MAQSICHGELHGAFAVVGSVHRVDGRLRLDDGRAVLELERSMLTPDRPRLPDCITIEGQLLSGQPVTLIDYKLRSRRIGTGERYIEAWSYGRTVLGARITSVNAPAFSRVVFDLGGLKEALRLGGLSVPVSNPTQAITRRAVVEWEEPDPVQTRFGAAGLSFQSHARFAHGSDYDVRLSTHVLAELIPDSPMSLLDIDRVTDDLMSLVALATESAVSVQQVRAYSTPASITPVDLRSEGRRWYGPDPATNQGCFALSAVLNDVPGFVASFERFRRDRPEAAELLFEYQVFGVSMTPPDRLLYLARFLEAYHRGALVPTRVSFAERLRDLLVGPGAAAAAAFGGTPEELAKAIKDTRNYYVHYNAADRHAALHGIELDDLADRAWCVVRSTLWSDLGMSQATITEILEDDWRYRRAVASRLP